MTETQVKQVLKNQCFELKVLVLHTKNIVESATL